eukprot:CAMPEP_0170564098 /NCGR_PEP_ID=MMETSP0211-20121228/70958_1 /TAXON_ID=311385 /ORGANISM="Pseudokeronopsis sp., Strain OXSARD2" /LENGTH=192 /DNA_ID=CAMNT_0010883155 /DNA_START=1272 /DNA_END=1850 /DNA_ORIENTATION=-
MLQTERKRKRDLIEQDKKVNELWSKFNRHKEDMEVVKTKDVFYENICVNLIEIQNIVTTLMVQDEKDKYSISLMGVNEKEETNFINHPSQGKREVVQIDKKCLSCSAQSYKIISAFKMACLTYFPQSVQYQGKPISREELLELKGHMLDDLKKTVRNRGRKSVETSADISPALSYYNLKIRDDTGSIGGGIS